MCTQTSQCPEGHRCDTASGQCVPNGVIKDPIKPPTPGVADEETEEQ